MSACTNVKIRTTMYSIINSATWESFSFAFIWMVTHRDLGYLLKNTLRGLLTSTTRNYRSIAFVWVVTLGLFPQICDQHNKEHNKQHNKLYASAAHQAHLVSPGYFDSTTPPQWRDQTNLICRRSIPKWYPLVIYRTHIRPSEHDIVVIRGQWFHIARYQDTNTVDTASGPT